jgi:predicted SnoaL-like aldol condensation-catalyzing enzyme
MKHEVVLCDTAPLQSLSAVIKRAMEEACSFTTLCRRVYEYLKVQNHVVIGTWRIDEEIVVQYWDFSGDTTEKKTIKVPETSWYRTHR